jgi:hypothetical protein
MTLAFPHPAVRPLLLAAALAGAGCSAGSHSGDPVPRNEVEAARQAAARDGAAAGGSQERREVEERLLLNEEGRLLVHAMRAHGGWDAWRGAARVSYTLLNPPGAPSVEAVPAPASLPVEFPVDDALPVRGFLEERFLFGIAFRLADPAFRKEYLGVELDAAAGEYFEKLKVTREGEESEEWLMVFFNRSTWLLDRVLARGAGGKFTLIAFSRWVDAGGLRVATERRVWALEGPYAHWQPGVPDRVERLQDLMVAVREPPAPGGDEE